MLGGWALRAARGRFTTNGGRADFCQDRCRLRAQSTLGFVPYLDTYIPECPSLPADRTLIHELYQPRVSSADSPHSRLIRSRVWAHHCLLGRCVVPPVEGSIPSRSTGMSTTCYITLGPVRWASLRAVFYRIPRGPIAGRRDALCQVNSCQRSCTRSTSISESTL